MTENGPNTWNSIYEKFQHERHSVWKEAATPWFVSKMAFLKELGANRILDAACGDARNTRAFAESGFQVVGVDFSEKALARAAKNTSTFKNVTLQQHNLESLPFSEEFDAIACDYVAVHLQNPKQVVTNFYNALKPKGLLLIEFLSTQDPACVAHGGEQNSFMSNGVFHQFYSESDARHLLKDFTILETTSVWHDDPGHGPDFPRNDHHQHHSIYVIAQK